MWYLIVSIPDLCNLITLGTNQLYNLHMTGRISFITTHVTGIMPSELAPGTVCVTGDRAQGDDSKHCAYSTLSLKAN